MKQEHGFDLAKALSFLLAFVAFAMFIGVGFLVPTVRSLNKQSTMLAIETKSYKAIKEKYDEEDTRLNNLKKENAVVLKALSTSFDPNRYQKLIAQKFNTQIQQTDTLNESAYSTIEYNIGMTFKDPKEMFLSFETLEQSGSLVKLQTPLILAKQQDGSLTSNYYIRAITANLGTKKETNTTKKH